MAYDRDDRFPSDFETNGIPFGSKYEEKLSPRSYLIQLERKQKSSIRSVAISEGGYGINIQVEKTKNMTIVKFMERDLNQIF